MRSVALWLFVGFARMQSGADPSVDSSVGESDVTWVFAPGGHDAELCAGNRGPDGLYRRRFHFQVAGPSTLYAWASSERVDPTLGGEFRGRTAVPHTGRAGRSAAFLSLGFDAPGVHEVELELEAPEEGAVQLVLTVAPEPPECAEAVRAAEEALAKHEALLAGADRAGALAALEVAAEGLFALDVARTSRPAALLLERIGRKAYDLGLRGPSYEARTRTLAFFERHNPERHFDLQRQRFFLAESCDAIGDPGRGIPALERALSALEIAGSPDPVLPMVVAERLGIALSRVGRILEARDCIEAQLQVLERSSHSQAKNCLLNAKSNLAVTLYQLGDLATARTRYEELLTDSAGVLPAHKLLGIQGNLAMVLADLGQMREAAAHQAQVLEGFQALPGMQQDAQRAHINLAASLIGLGRLDEAQIHFDQAFEGSELGPDDPLRMLVKFELAVARIGSDPAEARRLLEDVLERRERTLDREHPLLHQTRILLAKVLFQLGEREALEHELRVLLPALRRRIAGAAGLGRHERAELARQIATSLRDFYVLASGTGAEAELERELFGITESLRTLAALSPRIPDEAELDPELRALRAAWREASARLVERLKTGGEQEPAPALGGIAGEAAAAERGFRAALAARGWLASPEVSVESVARSLSAGSAAVTYRRLAIGGEGLPHAGLDGAGELMASVVLPDGRYRFLDLGPTSEVDGLVQAWRAAVGRPIGGAPGPGDPAAEARAGRGLRALVLDPVLEAAEGAREFQVCLDDALHLVPLDALPAGDEGPALVGDRLRLRVLPSLAGGSGPETSRAPRWLGIGAVDYGRAAEGRARSFAPLPGTEGEVRAIAAALSEHPDHRVTLLLGSDATAERVRREAEAATHLHIGTHGFFAGERVLTWDDPLPSGMAHLDPRFAVTGLAPLAACGLALAGANRPRGGVVLGEELATWDLSGVELAVLSACESGVGLRRAGQGVSSLQAALHAAGANAVVASLWRVDDRSTAQLLERFYELFSSEPGLDPADALARAKDEFRAQRRPTRDWAGWLLTRRSGGP